MMTPFFQGFGTGGGLIVAIGAQNAFILSQGIRKNHPLIIAAICIFCDVLFITLGVAGIGAAVSRSVLLSRLTAWGGTVFLFLYGFQAFRSAMGNKSLNAANQGHMSLGTAIISTLAVTLLNPHFYLDTIVLIGSIASRFPHGQRFYFWAGSVTASTLWFISLSLGARVFAPVFKNPLSWRILDALIGLTLWSIAFSLTRYAMTL
jgi:L-lysine exporter family protein LysE/ArgO